MKTTRIKRDDVNLGNFGPLAAKAREGDKQALEKVIDMAREYYMAPKWHDLRKCPGDLPTETGMYILLFEDTEGETKIYDRAVFRSEDVVRHIKIDSSTTITKSKTAGWHFPKTMGLKKIIAWKKQDSTADQVLAKLDIAAKNK